MKLKWFLIICILATVSFFALCCKKDLQEKSAAGKDLFSVQLISSKTTPVSSYLLGFNTVYANEPDILWSDGKIESYLKEVNASVLRYPGGTVASFYHWNELTGEGWKDSWDPLNPVKAKSTDSFMDFDEYISVVRKTGVTPLVGINMSSGRRWNRLEDGINEALELMKYCRDKNFSVKFWYLDNEPYQPDSNGGSKTIDEYAGLINAFVSKMKEFDPGIKIIVNWNSSFKTRTGDYKKLLSLAGDNIDIIDVHWYWNWNNPTFGNWLAKTPMEVWSGGSYMSEIALFRQMMTDFGHADIGLASLEWNVGPVKNQQLTPHQCALIQSEMLMQFIAGGLDMATFWPLQGTGPAVTPRSLVNRNDIVPQPVHGLFKFLGRLQGWNLCENKIISPQPAVMIISASDPSEKAFRICFLNKNQNNVKVEIATDIIKNMKSVEAGTYILTNQGSELIPAGQVRHSSTGISFEAPSTSLTMLAFEKQ